MPDARYYRVDSLGRGLLVAMATAISVGAAAPGVAPAKTCFHPAGNVPFGQMGELNGNGVVNVADALCVVLVALTGAASGGSPPSWPGCLAVEPVRADLNCDGKVDVSDVTLVISFALGHGLPPEVPTGSDGCPAQCAPCAAPGEGSCLVDGVCVPEGGWLEPASCVQCVPSVDVMGLVSAAEGAACGEGLTCQQGVCLPPTSPDGCHPACGSGSVCVDGVCLVGHTVVHPGGATLSVVASSHRDLRDAGGPETVLTLHVPNTGEWYANHAQQVTLVTPYGVVVNRFSVRLELTPDSPGLVPGAVLDLYGGRWHVQSSAQDAFYLGTSPNYVNGIQSPEILSLACIRPTPPVYAKLDVPQLHELSPVGRVEVLANGDFAITYFSTCDTAYCPAGECVEPSCADGVQNGDETGPDCGGGVCAPCGEGQGCKEDTDCAGALFCGAAGHCAAATCADGVQNGDETDVDCGGPVCAACPAEATCSQDADCLVGHTVVHPGGATLIVVASSHRDLRDAGDPQTGLAFLVPSTGVWYANQAQQHTNVTPYGVLVAHFSMRLELTPDSSGLVPGAVLDLYGARWHVNASAQDSYYLGTSPNYVNGIQSPEILSLACTKPTPPVFGQIAVPQQHQMSRVARVEVLANGDFAITYFSTCDTAYCPAGFGTLQN